MSTVEQDSGSGTPILLNFFLHRLFIDEDWGSTTEGVKQPTNGTGGGGASGLRRDGKDDFQMLLAGQIFGPLSQMLLKKSWGKDPDPHLT
jgi:hypothetical protein